MVDMRGIVVSNTLCPCTQILPDLSVWLFERDDSIHDNALVNVRLKTERATTT